MLNKRQKLFDNPILMALFGALLGFLITILTKKTSLDNLPISETWLVLLILIALSALLGGLYSKISSIEENTFSLLNQTGANFKIISPNEASILASKMIKESEMVRIIGTARQDVIETKNSDVAKRYLLNTETRFSKKEHIIYRRITSKNIRLNFANHLLKLIERSKKNKHSMEIKLIDNIEPIISYQVFDEKGVLVFIDNHIVSNISDNALAMWSTEEIVIKTFSEHFESAWRSIEKIDILPLLKNIENS